MCICVGMRDHVHVYIYICPCMGYVRVCVYMDMCLCGVDEWMCVYYVDMCVPTRYTSFMPKLHCLRKMAKIPRRTLVLPQLEATNYI